MKASIGFESTILIVDDNIDLLDVIDSNIKDYFTSVITVESAGVAIDLLTKKHIDCVVTDYKMPGMNGLELISYVNKNFPSIPTLLLTGNGADPEVIKAIESGLFDYLEKPFHTPVLINRIRNALLLPRLESLIIDLIHVEFPEIQTQKFLDVSPAERLKTIAGFEALVRTRLLASKGNKIA